LAAVVGGDEFALGGFDDLLPAEECVADDAVQCSVVSHSDPVEEKVIGGGCVDGSAVGELAVVGIGGVVATERVALTAVCEESVVLAGVREEASVLDGVCEELLVRSGVSGGAGCSSGSERGEGDR
jgi:hypothetical protein